MITESSLETVRTVAEPVHHVGSLIYLSPETFARAAGWGWANPLAFYFAGRGGVLGEVPAPVAVSALGYFNPRMALGLFEEGAAVGGARKAGERMAEATALWGRDHLAGLQAVGRFVDLADRLVDGAEGAGRTLFAGWRDQERAGDPAGRAAQLFQILREWRGAAHLVATTSVGLSPLEAIISNEGPGQAKFFGWSEPFPDREELEPLHQEAELITDRLCAADVESALSGPEQSELCALVVAGREAADR